MWKGIRKELAQKAEAEQKEKFGAAGRPRVVADAPAEPYASLFAPTPASPARLSRSSRSVSSESESYIDDSLELDYEPAPTPWSPKISRNPRSPDPSGTIPKSPVPRSQVPKSPRSPDPRSHVPKSPVPKSPDPKSHVPKSPVPKSPVPKSPVPKSPDPRSPVPKSPKVGKDTRNSETTSLLLIGDQGEEDQREAISLTTPEVRTKPSKFSKKLKELKELVLPSSPKSPKMSKIKIIEPKSHEDMQHESWEPQEPQESQEPTLVGHLEPKPETRPLNPLYSDARRVKMGNYCEIFESKSEKIVCAGKPKKSDQVESAPALPALPEPKPEKVADVEKPKKPGRPKLRTFELGQATDDIRKNADFINQRTIESGYIEVPHTEVDKLEIGDKIRYINAQGILVEGGYIQDMYYEASDKCFHFRISMNARGGFVWAQTSSRMQKIWKYPQRPETMQTVECIVQFLDQKYGGEFSRQLPVVRSVAPEPGEAF